MSDLHEATEAEIVMDELRAALYAAGFGPCRSPMGVDWLDRETANGTQRVEFGDPEAGEVRCYGFGDDTWGMLVWQATFTAAPNEAILAFLERSR